MNTTHSGTPTANLLLVLVACAALCLSAGCGGSGKSAADDGLPTLISQSPAAGSSVAVGSLTGFPTSSVITLDFDESLDPATVNSSNVVIVNKTINTTMDVPVGASVSLMQQGSIMASPGVARIVVTTTTPLPDGHTFAVALLGVTDMLGNAASMPSGGTAFSTVDEANNTTVVFTDEFTQTVNLGTLGGSVVWPGTVVGDPNSGLVAGLIPEALVGNGLDGVGDFPNHVIINADNQLTPGDPKAMPAVFNFTTLSFGTAGMPRSISFSSTIDNPPGEANLPVTIRVQGAVKFRNSVSVIFDGRRQTIQGGTGASSVTTSINGGWGGPGGRRGGTASPTNSLTFIDPAGNPGIGPGGGGGGTAGVNLAFAPNHGPAGGGGGTGTGFIGYGGMPPAGNMNITFIASTDGETQTGIDGDGLGAPVAGLAGQATTNMMTPLVFAVGGSGGGASGDRGNAAAANSPLTYRAGAAGGGGGGAFTLLAGGTIEVRPMATISANGGQGGSAIPPFVAHGGGGSGGSIFMRTLGTFLLTPSATLSARGGLPGIAIPLVPSEPVLNGEGGRGGDGVIQLQDSTGTFITTSLGLLTVNGELFASVNPFASTTVGQVRSQPIDTGSTATDYLSATAVTNTGSDPSSLVEVKIIGVAEDPNSPGLPAQTAVSTAGTPLMAGPFPLSEIDKLDGYRFFIFEITLTYPLTPGITFPSVDEVRVDYAN